MLQQTGLDCGPKKPIPPMLPDDELPGESTKVPRFAVAEDDPGDGPEGWVPTTQDPLPVPTKDGRDWLEQEPIDGYSIPAELSGDSGKDPKAPA